MHLDLNLIHWFVKYRTCCHKPLGHSHFEIHIASLCLIPVKMIYKQVVINRMCRCMQILCPIA